MSIYQLSTTRYVLEALRAAGVPASDRLFERALVFVEMDEPGKPG